MRIQCKLLIISIFYSLIYSTNVLSTPLELKNVTLSKSGVAFLEYIIPKESGADHQIKLSPDQINDFLKSSYVSGVNTNDVYVYMPSQPSVEIMKHQYPFQPEDLSSLPRLLQKMQGAKLRIRGAVDMDGYLVSVEPFSNNLEEDTNKAEKSFLITLKSKNGFRKVFLEEIEFFQFLDPEIDQSFHQALKTLYLIKDKAKRKITISLSDTSKKIHIGFITESPAWKSSYRLLFNDDHSANIEAWAIVENMTGQDWYDVNLTLLEGSPVSYKEDLYPLKYVNRPYYNKNNQETIYADIAAGHPPSALREALSAKAIDSSFSAQEQQTQTIFEKVSKNSLTHGETQMVSLFNEEVPAKLISMFNVLGNSRHPDFYIDIQNTSNYSFPNGPITVYSKNNDKTNFMGDTHMSAIQIGGSERFKLAQDLKTSIDHIEKEEHFISNLKVNDGILRIQKKQIKNISFTVQAPEKENRDLVILYPKESGWKKENISSADIEIKPSFFSITKEILAGAREKIMLTLSKPISEEIEFSSLNIESFKLALFGNNISDQQITMLQPIIVKMKELNNLKRQEELLENKKISLADNQSRIRENMAVLSKTDALYKNYLKKLALDETQFDEILVKVAEMNERKQQINSEISDLIDQLSF